MKASYSFDRGEARRVSHPVVRRFARDPTSLKNMQGKHISYCHTQGKSDLSGMCGKDLQMKNVIGRGTMYDLESSSADTIRFAYMDINEGLG